MFEISVFRNFGDFPVDGATRLPVFYRSSDAGA